MGRVAGHPNVPREAMIFPLPPLRKFMHNAPHTLTRVRGEREEEEDLKRVQCMAKMHHSQQGGGGGMVAGVGELYEGGGGQKEGI